MTYKLFKQKTQYSLHQAVRMKREDVLFLYLIDNDADVCFFIQSLVFLRKKLTNLPFEHLVSCSCQ